MWVCKCIMFCFYNDQMSAKNGQESSPVEMTEKKFSYDRY